ncbi:MAG: ComF family protein [Candidatus Omnitrophica bacterium]|nr:ComF family protein [Candidatus Omnitrophota bacterium]
MRKTALALGRAFLNLVYPITCYICGEKLAENKGLCDRCLSKIETNAFGIAACRYEGVIKEALRLFKYKNAFSLINTFSRLFAEFIDRNIDMRKIDLIIPVPLHPVKLRERGFNQARLLAQPIARRYNVPISISNLIKVKYTKPQSGLNRNQRLRNLRNAFSVKKAGPLKGKKILLIDDVYTTGTTVNKASYALKRAGALEVKTLTLARGI